MLFGNSTWQASVWWAVSSTAVGRVHAVRSGISAYLNLDVENAALRHRNVVLEQRVAALTVMLERATHDSTVTERRMAQLLDTVQTIQARVVSHEVHRRDNFFIIDRGRLDGVHAEMGVVDGRSIVGIVFMAGDHYSVVMPILHSGSSISCRLRGTGTFGYLRWKGGSTRHAMLDDVPRHARIKVGDVVETSGLSSLFPEGIFVGRVKRIMNSDDGLSYQLDVHLATDFDGLRNVAVLESRPYSEEIRALQDSINVSRP